MQKIVITGPESTGKTTLAELLAQHYHTQWVPEYSRTYLGQLNRPYEYRDLLVIAKGQLAREQSYQFNDKQFLFCDTSMLVMKVWSGVKYGKMDPWIDQQLKNNQYELFLLCKPDIPWEYDPLRENPADRDKLFDIYLQALKSYELKFDIITGNTPTQRLSKAINAIEDRFG